MAMIVTEAPAAEDDRSGFAGWMEAVAVRSMVCLPRLAWRLTVDFAGFDVAAFCTFAWATFLVFAVLGSGAAFGVAEPAAKPLSARGLKGALFAGLKAKAIIPAATAAATTVNLCM